MADMKKYHIQLVSSIRYKLVCAYSKDSNQSKQSHNLIKVLVFHLKKPWDPWLPKERPLKTDQTVWICRLSLRLAHMPTCTFPWTTAQFVLEKRAVITFVSKCLDLGTPYKGVSTYLSYICGWNLTTVN